MDKWPLTVTTKYNIPFLDTHTERESHQYGLKNSLFCIVITVKVLKVLKVLKSSDSYNERYVWHYAIIIEERSTNIEANRLNKGMSYGLPDRRTF